MAEEQPTTKQNEGPSLRGEYDAWFAGLGSLVTAFSLISIIRRVFNVGLVPVLSGVLGYYESIKGWLTGWTSWLPFSVPELYKDLYVISFAITAAFIRSVAAHARGQEPVQKIRAQSEMLYAVGTAFFVLVASAVGSLVLIGFFLFWIALRSSFSHKSNEDAAAAGTRKAFWISVACCVAAVAVFFALNSQGV